MCQWIIFSLNHKRLFYVLHVPVHAKWILYLFRRLATKIRTEILFKIPKCNYSPLKNKQTFYIYIYIYPNISLDNAQNIWNTRNRLFLSKQSLKSIITGSLEDHLGNLIQRRERDSLEHRSDSNMSSLTVRTEFCFNVVFYSKG